MWKVNPAVFAVGRAYGAFDFLILNGDSYYTFRLGKIWGMALDCGEDKMDKDPEYGSTICCHAFRQQETAFIRQVIADARTAYEAES